MQSTRGLTVLSCPLLNPHIMAVTYAYNPPAQPNFSEQQSSGGSNQPGPFPWQTDSTKQNTSSTVQTSISVPATQSISAIETQSLAQPPSVNNKSSSEKAGLKRLDLTNQTHTSDSMAAPVSNRYSSEKAEGAFVVQNQTPPVSAGPGPGYQTQMQQQQSSSSKMQGQDGPQVSYPPPNHPPPGHAPNGTPGQMQPGVVSYPPPNHPPPGHVGAGVPPPMGNTNTATTLPPPPAYIKTVSMNDASNFNSDAHLLALCKSRGISPYFATQLLRLRDFSKVRLILDDSGSMKSTFGTPGLSMSGQGGQPGQRVTRWSLLKEMVDDVFDILSIARGGSASEDDHETNSGIEVYFLNRLPQGTTIYPSDPSASNAVSGSQQLQEYFSSPPSGTTPTLELLQSIFTRDKMSSEMGVLTVIITDGAPNCGHHAMRVFLQNVQTMFPASFITVGLCTDDDATIDEYENSLDQGVAHLDVMSPYPLERKEIIRTQGRGFTFSKADWTVKFLLGSRVVEWDMLDEKRLRREDLAVVRSWGNRVGVWEDQGGKGGAGGRMDGDHGSGCKGCLIM